MRLTKLCTIVFSIVLLQNTTKAQHNVYEPSVIKKAAFVAEIPALGSSYKYEHKVTKLSIPGQSIKGDNTYKPQLENAPYNEVSSGANKKAASAPNNLFSFKGNTFNGYTPPDNAMAIANNGYIVSSINSNVYYYDSEGSIRGFTTFLRLSRDYFDEISEDLFDPRVLYDQEEDRFIMIILNGHEASTSQVLLFFSKTNDPMDGWYAYTLDGDVNGNNDWFDYPNIAVNSNSLFVSGNMFDTNDRFSESIVLNIDKKAGFKGEEITYSNWDGLQTPLGEAFTVVPVEKGTRGNYSEKAWFVCTDGDFANFIVMYELNPSTGNLEANTITVPYYDIANDAEMLGTSEKLDMGDARIKNAILIDNTIHVVHTTTTVNKYAAVGYHRIDVQNKTAETAIFHKDGKKSNLAYPSVASSGTTSTDQSVIIAYTETNAKIYPQLCAISVDEDMEDSGETILQEGEGFIDILEDDVERWGDYITLTNRVNGNTVWLFGCVGGSGERHDNYLFELSLDQVASTPNLISKPKTAVDVYPNPVQELVTLAFELDKRQSVSISLFDNQGRLIELLTKDTFNEGKHLLNFDMFQLDKGIYFLKIEGRSGLLAQKQLIK